MRSFEKDIIMYAFRPKCRMAFGTEFNHSTNSLCNVGRGHFLTVRSCLRGGCVLAELQIWGKMLTIAIAQERWGSQGNTFFKFMRIR